MGNLLEFLRTNFLHVAPILAAGAFAIAICFERARALYFDYPLRNPDYFFEKLRDLVMGDRLAEAIAFCDQYGQQPVAKVARAALLRHTSRKS